MHDAWGRHDAPGTEQDSLLELGQALTMVKEHVSATRALGAVAQRMALDPSGRIAAATTAEPEIARSPLARHFERDVYTNWALALERLGQSPRPVYDLAVRRKLWRDPLQRPLDHCAR